MSEPATVPETGQFPCKKCGASLTFAPGTQSLQCPYCGTLNQIAGDDRPVLELDYQAQLQQLDQTHDRAETLVVHCQGCGAESTLPPGTTAGTCPFCGRAIVAAAESKCLIKPRSLLPFAIDRSQATPQFARWLGTLWFAPNALKTAAETGKLVGLYLPAWTYDCRTTSDYTGSRGEHYWVTESYTETVNGQTVTRTREVQHTRWYPAAGRVFVPFDDILVLADRSLPDKLLRQLDGWDLSHLTPYADEYLSGFIAETYQVTLPDGFELAKQVMDGVIRRAIDQDIGGDEQRIDSFSTQYADITFKHILLPVWISAYRFRGQTYHFIINGRTGRVFGERPYSGWKIALAVLLGLLLVLAILFIVNAQQH